MRIDDALLAEAKKLANETGRTLSAFIEDALRDLIARSKKQPTRRRFRLPTFRGDGLIPGLDLDDSAALLDLMERGDRPR